MPGASAKAGFQNSRTQGKLLVYDSWILEDSPQRIASSDDKQTFKSQNIEISGCLTLWETLV